MGKESTTPPTLYALRVPTPVRNYLNALRKEMHFPNMSELVSFLILSSVESKPWERPDWVWIAPRVAMLSRAGLGMSQININIFDKGLAGQINEQRDKNYLSANAVVVSLLFDVIKTQIQTDRKHVNPLLEASMSVMGSQVHASIDPNIFQTP